MRLIPPKKFEVELVNRTGQHTRNVQSSQADEMCCGVRSRQWKKQFHTLDSEIRVKSCAYVCWITKVFALLHNISKDRNTGLPAKDEGQGIDKSMDPCPPQVAPQLQAARCGGLHYRDEYVNLHFNDTPHCHAARIRPV